LNQLFVVDCSINCLNKVYCLKHSYKYSVDIEGTVEYFSEKKTIGFFYSFNKALKTLEGFKCLPGFKDHKDGFYIDTFDINSLYNSSIGNLVSAQNELNSNQDKLFGLYYIREYEEDDDEIEALALFSTEEKATAAKEVLILDPLIKPFSEFLEVLCVNFQHIEWSEGFTKWAPTPTELRE